MENIIHTLLAGFIVSIAWFIAGGILYMNPVVKKIYSKFENNPGMKKWGDQKKYLLSMYFVGALIPSLIFSFVYTLISPISILYFGLILVGVRIMPRFFDMWIQSSYPNKLLFVEIINGSILSFIAAIIFSLV
ncbi:hypothetical protein KKC60_01405 [Patescibacteria group bacterium]|nr:hypothetical protein [Patescibacteria group bacterium]